MRHILADAINRMPDREKIVLTLYYYEGLTLAEIGEVLGVTESRVCQIHTKAVLQLALAARRPAALDPGRCRRLSGRTAPAARAALALAGRSVL